jgi:hypothetical protein
MARRRDTSEPTPAQQDALFKLRVLGQALANRDLVIAEALDAGVEKTLITALTGIARTTINRIAAKRHSTNGRHQ